MENGCTIEVEVNGEETSIVDMIGYIEITPNNLVLVNFAADFMEIDSNSSSKLAYQTEKFLRGIDNWNWTELILALKQCQAIFVLKDSSFVIEKTLDSVLGKIVSITVGSQFGSCSSENFCSQFSSDTSSTCSTRNIYSTPFWFEDLAWLKARLFEKIVKIMVFQKQDHSTLFKFLIFYLKSRLGSASRNAEKRLVIEVVISSLSYLERRSISCKGLFEILRIVSRVKGKNKCSVVKLERLIGSKLDQASIDQLMISSRSRKYSVYDVNFVLRLVKMLVPDQMKKVGSLIDSYLIEVASDFRLKPLKFEELARVLPDFARESNDKLYQAIDLYLQVHTQLCEEEKMSICSALNYGKLSKEALKHVARNSRFPSREAVQDFVLKDKNIRSRNKYARKHEYLIDIGNLDSQLHRDCGKIESKSRKMKCNSARIRYMPRFC